MRRPSLALVLLLHASVGQDAHQQRVLRVRQRQLVEVDELGDVVRPRRVAVVAGTAGGVSIFVCYVAAFLITDRLIS